MNDDSHATANVENVLDAIGSAIKKGEFEQVWPRHGLPWQNGAFEEAAWDLVAYELQACDVYCSRWSPMQIHVPRSLNHAARSAHIRMACIIRMRWRFEGLFDVTSTAWCKIFYSGQIKPQASNFVCYGKNENAKFPLLELWNTLGSPLVMTGRKQTHLLSSETSMW